MNGRNRKLAGIGVIAFAGLVSLLSCSSSDPTSPDLVGGGGGGIPGSTPSIAFVLPDETCTNAGNTITVYGTNFPTNPVPTVTINGVTGTVVGLGSATLDGQVYEVLTVETGFDPATIPPSGLLVTVTVSTASGTTSLPNALRMLPGCTRPPAVVSVDPSSASRTGGDLVTISGIDLACATSVSFSGTQTPGLVLGAAIVSVIDDTSILVSAPVNPSLTSETFDVTVTSDCGTGVLPGAFIFTGGGTGELVPNATSIAPPEGPASGGNDTLISGSDLNLVDSISIGSVTLDSSQFVVQANGQILIPMMPASPVGPSITVPINVTVSAGGAADNSPVVYTYLGEGAPECGMIAPTSGTQAGGTSVIITAALGSQLDSIDGVTFGGVPATGIVHPNSSQLAVTAPAYPVALDVEVVLTVGGTPVSTCPLNFTYTPSDPSAAFSVDSIFPDQGPQSGGTQIQISGSGLTAVTSIDICDVPASITATTEELVTAVTGRFDGTTPATCDVVVQAGSLGATLPGAFTYTPVVPDGQFFIDGASTAPEAGGLNFRIQGTELIGVTQVSFSGSQGASGQALACEVQVQGNTEVTGIVPRYFTPGGPFPADVDVFVSSSGGIDPNTSVSLTTGRRFRYYANPRLLAASGPGGNDLVDAGQLVTVTGLNFTPENDVFVGSLEISNSGVLEGRSAGEETLLMPFSVLNNNTLSFFFPAASVQDFYDITIQTPLPLLDCTEDYSFTLLRSIFFGTPPAAASVDPPSGPFFGGTNVVISGDFDTEVTLVTINGVSQPILEQTPTSVTVVTQSVLESTAGVPLDVVVTGRGGNSIPLIGAYTFIPQPEVVSAATTTVNCAGLVSPPAVLPVTQGQVITVTGDDLIGVNSATVGGVVATVFPIDDTTVEVAIPPAPGEGGPIFDVVVQATFEAAGGGTPEDPLSGILLTAVRYQDPPTVAGIEPPSADPGSFVTISGTSLLNADGTPTIVDFGGVIVPAGDVSPSPDGTLLLVRVPPGPEGQSVQVQVETCQGSAFSPVAFMYPCNPPIVNSLTPAAGAGGTVVTIAGTSLISADGSVTSVTFDGQQALINFLASTPTSLVVTAPPGEAGVRASVELTTCGGEGVLAGFFTYGCGNPQITGITPAQGRAGTIVVISGSNLDSPDGTPVTVLFGANPAIVNTGASTSTELIVTAPVGVGAVTITVTNCGSTTNFSTPPFTYCNTPTANLGAATGAVNDVVVVTGTSLLNPDTTRPLVTFGGVPAVVLETPIPSNTAISVQVPANTGNQVVQVETCGGIATAGSFQYCLRPNVTGFSPGAAPAGALVTIQGAELLGADGILATITFGGVAATVVDDSPFVVRVPAGPTGTAVVEATTCGGVSTALFTYCDLPTITDVNVGGGAPEGPAGTAVSIVGTDFIGGDGANPTVLFGTQAATIIDVSATNILVTAPGGIADNSTVTVRVTSCGGTASSGLGDNYTYRDLAACPTPPSAATITIPVAASGPAGTQVTIEGTAIVGEDGNPGTVLFGAFSATIVASAADVPTAGTDTLVVTAPDGGFADLTNVPVTIQTCGGPTSVPGGFTYLDVTGDCVGGAVPSALTLSPISGGVGAQVSIEGADLFGADGLVGEVRFGAFVANIVASAEDVPAPGTDTIVVTAPDGGFPDMTPVSVRVENCAGVSAVPAIYTYLGAVDCPGGAVPSALVLTPATGGQGASVTITGADLFGPDGNVGTVRFGPFTATQVTAVEDLPAMGTDTIVVTAPAGFNDGDTPDVTVENCVGLSAGVTFTYTAAVACPGGAAPSALVLSPATGGQGSSVTITGADLFGPDGLVGVVRFGPFTATQVTAVEDLPAAGTDTIVVTAPAGFNDGDTPDVTVENCVGLSAGVTFTYTGAVACPGGAVPTALVLSPASGGQGSSVTITGADLFGPDGLVGVVRFGPFTATQVTAVEDLPAMGTDTIVVTAPAGFNDGDTPDVTVENCVGLSAGVTFTYTGAVACPGGAVPTALVLSPASGGQGSTVTITGADLFGPDGLVGVVRFGPFTATQVTAVEDLPAAGTDTIVVTAPAGFNDGDTPDVTVENCVGLSAGVTFTYTGAVACPGGAVPTALVLSPASGGQGSTVTITGADLFGPDGLVGVVRFGPFTATQVTAVEDLPAAGTDTIVVTAPAGFNDGDTPDVTVENCVGLSAGVTFTYTGAVACPGGAVPTALVLSPASGGQGSTVTITGADLFGPDGLVGVVRFGPFTATQVTAVEDLPAAGTDTIVVTAPAGFNDGDTPDVTVENCVGLSAGVTFTYTGAVACPGGAVPTALVLSPAMGGAGVQVTITGADLFGPDGNVGVVRFGAFTATQISAVEDLPAAGTDTIVVTAPATFGAGDTPDVTVENCVGLSAGVTFTYTADCVAPSFVAPGAPGPVDPDSGPAGTLVTLAGMDFVGADGNDPVVQFGTRVATLVNVTATSVVVSAPAGIPNGVPVSVRLTNCGGTAIAGETFTYSDVASCVGMAPGVASLSTTSGAAGDPILITGTDLIGPDGNISEVRFGTFVAQVIDFFDDPAMLADTMLVIVPGGPPVGATVTVSVENCAGTDQSQTFMYELPADCTTNISAPFTVTPPSGTANEIVTITAASGLIGDDSAVSQVFFGVEPATVLDQTDTQLLVRAPANVPSGETVNVTVSHCGDTEVVGTFMYDTIFDAQTIAPTSGPRTGGQTVVITGTGLALVDTVTICGVAATVEPGATNSSVTITTGEYFGPAPAVCDVLVADTVAPTDSDTMSAAYTYTPLLPDGVDLDDETDPSTPAETAPASGGTTFRIRGTDLLDVDDVTFGGLVNDPKACELQAQNDSMGTDDLLTGVVPAYRTGGGPFPANVQIFVESDAGRDNTPVVRDSGFAPLFTYYANPSITNAYSDDDDNMVPDADCGAGCGRPGRRVRVDGAAMSPEFWGHVGRVMLTEVGGGSGVTGDVPFSIDFANDGGGGNSLEFFLPGSAQPNDVFDITIFTPNNDATCTGSYSQILFGAIKVEEFDCIDGADSDADGDADCADSDCVGFTGPEGVPCEAAELNCDDTFDQDGDGLPDCLDPDCDGLDGGGFLCENGTEVNCGDGGDNDGDGGADCADIDCDTLPCAPGMTCVAGACA